MKRTRSFAGVLMGILLMACASGVSTVRLQGGSAVPAAEGTIRVSSGPNRNTRLQIDVRHLAHPDRLGPNTTVFVVWARPAQPDGQPQNLGALRVDKDLSGTLETVTPLRTFDVMITAEPTAGALQPSGEPLLTAHINRV